MFEMHLAWSHHTTITEGEDNQLQIRSPRRQLVTEHLSAGQRAAFDSLKDSGISTKGLLALFEHEDLSVRMKMVYYRQECIRLGLIQQLLVSHEEPIAGVVSISNRYWPREEQVPPEPTLSRFALLRPYEEHFVLESPLSLVQIHLYDRQCLAWVGSLLSGPSPSDTSASGPSSSGKKIPDKAFAQEASLLQLLANAKMLTNRLADGRTQEETDDTLRQWQFHDLYFHSRSRSGRTPEPVGGTYRFRGSISPQPVCKPPMSESIIPLPCPDLEQLAAEEPSLSTVLEQRRSRREERAQPPTLDALGAFLFRCARIKKVDEEANVSWRPYPSGGAQHELEIYVAVDQCTGLEPTLYHYAPSGHQLEKLTVDSKVLEKVLSKAATAQAMRSKPCLLFLVAARFQRVSWKYSALAYALTLKNVGGLMQTMYLVATAMDLAPCALGTGDNDLFAHLTAIDPLKEGLVGEFALR